MPNLRAINLSDNAMGLKGISACGPLFTASRATLSSLSMCNDGLSHQSMGEVADLLCAEPAIQLEKLHFFNNMSGDVGCEHFKRILMTQTVPNKMTDLRFSGTRVSSAGSAHIAEALSSLNSLFGASLRFLDLNDNTFSSAGATLASAFSAGFGKDLIELNLGECSMGDDTAKAICGALIKGGAGTLTKLELSGNELTIQSMKKVGKLASKNKALKTFGLSDNELSSGGIVALVDSGLKACSALQEIKINSSEVGDRGGNALALAAGAWSELKRVELDGNMFTTEISEKLVEAFGEMLPEMEDNDEDGADGDSDDEEIDDDDDDEEEEVAEEEENGKERDKEKDKDKEEADEGKAIVAAVDVDSLTAAMGGTKV